MVALRRCAARVPLIRVFVSVVCGLGNRPSVWHEIWPGLVEVKLSTMAAAPI